MENESAVSNGGQIKDTTADFVVDFGLPQLVQVGLGLCVATVAGSPSQSTPGTAIF